MADKNRYKINFRGKEKSKRAIRRITSPKVLPTTLTINGTRYIENYQFSCGNSVPIYEVLTVHGFTQLIGHAKFNNQSYGNIYYRGECKIHDSLKPSLFRTVKKIDPANIRLMSLVQKVINDERMKNELKLSQNDFETDKVKVEGMLQHYGVPTRFIDVVDNHWVALWMGLNKADKPKQICQYYHYIERQVPLIELADGRIAGDDEIFQYVLLLAVPFSNHRTFTGIQISNNYIEVDLRQALPSIFLRPHAQHGLVIRRKVHDTDASKGVEAYDLAPIVVGIIKIRIDRVKQWIGTGELLTQNNLFPPPAYDYGYDLLLKRSDLFDDSVFEIARYI